MRYEKSYGNWLPGGPNSEIISHSLRYGIYVSPVKILILNSAAGVWGGNPQFKVNYENNDDRKSAIILL